MSAVVRGSALAAVLALWTAGAAAQTGESARPGRGPAEEAATTNVAPPATTGQTTGATGQNQVVRSMNEAEKAKVEEKGK